MENTSYSLQRISSIKTNKLEKGLVTMREVMRIDVLGLFFTLFFVDLLKSNVCLL